jgi:hypothetical protein
MKRIVSTLPKAEFMTPQDIRFYGTEESIVAYVVSSQPSHKEGGTGVAVLVSFEIRAGQCKWGFVYHKELLKGFSVNGQDTKITFVTSSKKASIEEALKQRKEVFYLEEYEEFLNLCSQYPRY